MIARYRLKLFLKLKINPRYALDVILSPLVSLPSRNLPEKLLEEFNLIEDFEISHVLRIPNGTFPYENLHEDFLRTVNQSLQRNVEYFLFMEK